LAVTDSFGLLSHDVNTKITAMYISRVIVLEALKLYLLIISKVIFNMNKN
jgi:hypothetical protein